MALAPLGGLYALLFIAGRHDRLTSGPLVALALYGMLILFLNRTTTRIHPGGFATSFGPLPAGVGSLDIAKEQVRAIFRRYQYAGHKDPMPDRFYASVELNDGRWINVTGPYEDAEKADADTHLMAQTWGLPLPTERRQGMPAKRDWQAAILLLAWTGAFIAAFIWAAYAEIALPSRI